LSLLLFILYLLWDQKTIVLKLLMEIDNVACDLYSCYS